MKRSSELTPLSHDHHQALFTAHRLTRADAGAAAGFLAYWREHGSEHFRIEEEILLPAWLDADRDADVAMATRVLAEHLEIRRLVRALRRDELDAADLGELGALVQRHVRFEERELFPLIESGLSQAAIARLGEEIAAAERGGRQSA